jgi:hypothetical protein
VKRLKTVKKVKDVVLTADQEAEAKRLAAIIAAKAKQEALALAAPQAGACARRQHRRAGW